MIEQKLTTALGVSLGRKENIMKLVISALERQLKIEEAKLEKRERMLATADRILYSEPLQQANPEYVDELKRAIHILSIPVLVDSPPSQECYKSGKTCKHDCNGLCKESY